MALPTETINGISLCTGAGGLELGIALAEDRVRTVCMVERDAYAAAALVARMEDAALDDAPVWSDVKTFDGRPWRGAVDIITAGYPCQPFSSSGKRKGTADPRHIWPDIARIIREAKPSIVFFENVRGHLDRGFDIVEQDLRGMGFNVKAGLFSAAEVGASHIRERLFILGYTNSECFWHLATDQPVGNRLEATDGKISSGDRFAINRLDNYESPGGSEALSSCGGFAPGPNDFAAWERLLAVSPGLQPAVSRSSDGLDSRLDRLRLAGNGVCPLAAAYAWSTLVADAQGR